MKILLFGRNGQLGWELQRSLAPLGELMALSSEAPGGNFNSLDEVKDVIRGYSPNVIVNASAYTAVDNAENDRDLARQVNATAPAILAAEAKRHSALLVHYSTDYVFDGKGIKPWTEENVPAPLNIYGKTKLEGELAVQRSGCAHLIFRTSWVFASRGSNFAKTILRLAAEREELAVVSDQVGAPTGADLLADVTTHALQTAVKNPSVAGLYHVCSGGETSWNEYARFVLAFAEEKGVPLKAGPEEVRGIPSSEFPTPAQRPLNSRLDTSKFKTAFGLHLPHWENGVRRMLTEILEK